MYWFGAVIVLLSFVFINQESAEEEKQEAIIVDGMNASAQAEVS